MLEYLHGRLVQAIEDDIILSDACSMILRVTPVAVSRIVIVFAYLFVPYCDKDEKCTVNFTTVMVYVYIKEATKKTNKQKTKNLKTNKLMLCNNKQNDNSNKKGRRHFCV